MNNNLAENLKKIRKDHNLSQEQLAEELGVSRQAISKWESKTAYPEMEKIMQICEKFNLNIDDLLHKNIREIKKEEISKNNLNKYVDDFLNFITDTISLFSRMRFKSKIKCLLELIVIALILCGACGVIGALGHSVIFSILFPIVPLQMYNLINNLISSIYVVLAFVISLIILIHIFKIRYLDYYLKIKKDNQESEIIKKESKEEENIPEKEPISFKTKESKIIIRDPKHSEYKFINGLFKMIILGIKAFAILALMFFGFILIGIFALLVMSLTIIKTGIFFIGILITLLAIGTIDIIIIFMLLNFIFNRKNEKKLMIYSFVIATLFVGIGGGLIFVDALNFEVINVSDQAVISRYLELDMQEKLFFRPYYQMEYIEKDISNIQIEYTLNNACSINYSSSMGGIDLWSDCSNPIALIKEFIDNLNNQKFTNIDCSIKNIKIYATKENIEKMKANYNTYLTEESNYQHIIKSYKKQMIEYQKKIENYQDQIENYQNDLESCQNAVSDIQNELE